MADIKISTWQMKAKFGDAVAMNKLGLAYREGSGVEKDLAESVNWFYKAATAGNLDATFNMAIAFYQGLGVKVDLKEGIKWMSLAAELGHEDAMVDMYAKHYKGQIVDKDLNKAFYWLEKSAESGHIPSMRYMAFAYCRKDFMENIEADAVKATAWFQKAAEAGDTESMCYLGDAYLQGNGIEQDANMAAEWYKKGANAGDSSAKTGLGLLYMNGQGVEQNYAKAIQWFKKGADGGDGYAMYNLGQLYANGQGVKQDFAKAMDWYIKGAEAGSGSAMNILGKAYANGSGVNQDLAVAADWFKKAAENGHVEAMYSLGLAYYEGNGIQRNYSKAAKWFEKAAQNEYVEAMNHLGLAYKYGRGVEKDYDKAVKWFQKAVEKGNQSAMDNLGLAYEYGQGVEKDYEKAAIWFRNAAEEGHVEGMYHYGQAYYYGEGVENDYVKAAEWYRKAADAGYAQALHSVGLLYYSGKGVERDFLEAISWFKKAADAGYAAAMGNLGAMYWEGSGVEQNYSEAIAWFRKAADGGHARTMYTLGLVYYKGRGVEQDFAKAAAWFRKAAENEYAEAMGRLGDIFRNGEGVERDLEEAMRWYKKGVNAKDAYSMLRLGCAYQEGIGTDKDLEKAEKWLSKAVEGGQKEAYVLLAKNKLTKERSVSVAREAIELLQAVEDSSSYEDYDELLSIAQKIIAYEENFKQIMYEKFKVEVFEDFPGQKSAMDELDRMIGLQKVKEEVHNLKSFVEVQQKLKEMGKETQKMSLHMVFTGNPGTGKTTVARIIARILHEIGIIPTEKLIECDRTSLVAKYSGQTASQTLQVVESALGGVLFIDEAYTLSSAGDNFGQEAIDTLLKAMEDNRDNLIVIVAGYTNEMRDFIDSNPGLQSRFNMFLEFEDYTVPEMVQMFKLTCDSKGYVVADDAWQAVINEMTKINRNKSQTFANGRDVRNFFEKVLKKQNVRISRLDINSLSEMDFMTISKEDIVEEEEIKQSSQNSALAALDRMIGLDSVKAEVYNLKKTIIAQKKLRDMGRNVESASMHMVFTGNPGTGKTTVARIIAKVFHEIGIIPTDKLVECDRATLVGQHVGHTAPKTQAVIDSALGGVLFIVEAYALCPKDSSRDFGQEAINTLLKAMEDNRDNLIVIVAGYTKEMKDFIDTNPGLQSRFSLFMDFEDYTVAEMVQIFKYTCDSRGYVVSDDSWETVIKEMTKMINSKNENFANGRDVRNFFEKVLKKQNVRISRLGINGLTEMDFMTIMKEDIADETEEENEDESGVEQTSQKSALEELDGMIGLDSVKIEVLNLKKKIIAQKKLREMGRNVENASMHMVFTGNPGTGKTTVARIIAQVFHEIGVIPTDKLVECDRASLVGQYIGETAPKTQAVIDSALGGVLFIDEAYTLSPQDSPRDFGREAINTILKAMEDNRDNLIVIVAGYKKEMQDFLASNPGLESRFKYFIDFPDYIPDEMFEIFRSYCVKEQYEISEEAVPYLKEHFARMDAEKGEKFGNGRDVRNYYERVVQRVLVRFTEIGEDATEDDLVIRAEDVIEN